MPDSYDLSIPRGRYVIDVLARSNPEQTRITGVEFKSDRIHVLKGDPSVVHQGNPDEVYRAILAHELVHSQVTPKSTVSVESKTQAHSDMPDNQRIHYILGFKTVSVDYAKRTTTEPTILLDEYITQYLTMAMTNSFVERNPVLERIKKHGKGMHSEYIVGAEILNRAFRRHKISPQMVESLHSNSDFGGFVQMLKNVSPRFSTTILAAGIDNDRRTSIRKLRGIL